MQFAPFHLRREQPLRTLSESSISNLRMNDWHSPQSSISRVKGDGTPFSSGNAVWPHVGQAFQPDAVGSVRLESLTYDIFAKTGKWGKICGLLERFKRPTMEVGSRQGDAWRTWGAISIVSLENPRRERVKTSDRN